MLDQSMMIGQVVAIAEEMLKLSHGKGVLTHDECDRQGGDVRVVDFDALVEGQLEVDKTHLYAPTWVEETNRMIEGLSECVTQEEYQKHLEVLNDQEG